MKRGDKLKAFNGVVVFAIVTLLSFITLSTLTDWNEAAVVIVSILMGVLGEVFLYRLKKGDNY